MANATHTLNYVGSAIGNGLVDPQIQFSHYADYLDTYNPACPKGQCVKPAAIALMKGLDPLCTGLTAGCNAQALNGTLKWTACLEAYVMCAYTQLMPMEFSGINLYDVRKECTVPPLCYNFSLITARRKFAEHFSTPKTLRCTAMTWMLIVAQCSAAL